MTTSATTEPAEDRPRLHDVPHIESGYTPDQARSTDDRSLLTLRTFVILSVAFTVAVVSGTAAGLTAAYSASQSGVIIGILVGIAVFVSAMFAAATAMNALVAHDTR